MVSKKSARWDITLITIICVVGAFFGTLAYGVKEAVEMAVIGLIVGGASWVGLRLFWRKEE